MWPSIPLYFFGIAWGGPRSRDPLCVIKACNVRGGVEVAAAILSPLANVIFLPKTIKQQNVCSVFPFSYGNANCYV